MRKLYAISDIHLSYAANREALEALPFYPDDWLILAGDVGETLEQLQFALSVLCPRFAQVLWVPGNHDLWCLDAYEPRGVAKYERLVSLCQQCGVLTPEDSYIHWPEDPTLVLAPLFLLYDYSFRPATVPLEDAVDWAAKAGIVFRDEIVLYPNPYPSRYAWCQERLRITEQRLQAVQAPGLKFILINHFPFQAYPLGFMRHPEISLWSGTCQTEDWHQRFPTRVAIYGHLHMRGTYYRNGVRFEEVSLGYPQDWRAAKGVVGYLREIWPGPQGETPEHAEMTWRF
ncbi:metallophosphoesterase family protein [Tengunoibacter tsumagoiensis]|uniref:Metallophosphoesterase n=1 Tax=Tengunoibacter tsumagoiensis TaxID=2014871 RepID=A0A402A117_9CHLR|nr:metallophosphoesterase [Tengunoibacter tsumagoiensis]GCE12837.1 metallophosphoesterase [Tengunoibacter tsumagoiensis]